MLYSSAADLVVIVHLAFIVFVPVGPLLAWRWPWVLRLHVPSVAWAVGIVTVGFPCPLTSLEKFLRGSAGEKGYGGGFVDRYVEGVLYPESLTPLFHAAGAVAVVVGYALLHRTRSSPRLRRKGNAAVRCSP